MFPLSYQKLIIYLPRKLSAKWTKPSFWSKMDFPFFKTYALFQMGCSNTSSIVLGENFCTVAKSERHFVTLAMPRVAPVRQAKVFMWGKVVSPARVTLPVKVRSPELSPPPPSPSPRQLGDFHINSCLNFSTQGKVNSSKVTPGGLSRLSETIKMGPLSLDVSLLQAIKGPGVLTGRLQSWSNSIPTLTEKWNWRSPKPLNYQPTWLGQHERGPCRWERFLITALLECLNQCVLEKHMTNFCKRPFLLRQTHFQWNSMFLNEQ